MSEPLLLSQLIETRRNIIDPRLFPNEQFYYYSMPAFDECGEPEVVFGRQIDSSKFIVESGTILISKLNPRIKRVWSVRNDRTLRSLSSTEFVNVVPKNLHEKDFVYHLLSSDRVYRPLQRFAEGTTNSHVRFKPGLLGTITLKGVPNGSSRIHIAKILSTLDTTIEYTETLIAKIQQVKAGLMHDLFTRGVTPDGRLRPTREKAPELYKESPLGWIPKEWEVEKLGHILKRCGGYLQTGPFGSQLHAHEYQVEGIPVVMPQDINDGLIGTAQIARIHEKRADQLARHRMRVGDIVIARRGDLSRAASIAEAELGWVCGTGCFLLRLGQSSLRADFATYVYRQDFVQRQIAGRAVGTTMPSLNNSVMAGLYFPYCDECEQQLIVERLEGVEQSIRVFSEGLSVNRQIKHGLMHDLLTGYV